MRLKVNDKVGIVACSDPLNTMNKAKLDSVVMILSNYGLKAVISDYIFDKGNGFAGSGKQRALALMEMYKDPDIKAILDISGGDMANQLLPHLDLSVIKDNKKPFIGYSDLTVLCNAISINGENEAILYSSKNIIGNDVQIKRFMSFLLEDNNELFDFSYDFVRGEELSGAVVGGNIRCLLKLAGSQFFPNFKDKILLLEANGGLVPQMTTFLSQLKYLGVFEDIKGVLLGTFCKMEENGLSILDLLDEYLPKSKAIVQTKEIGHYPDSKAIYINRYHSFKKGS